MTDDPRSNRPAATPEPASRPTPAAAPDEFVPEDDRIIGLAFRWSLVAIVMIGAIVGGVIWTMRRGGEVVAPIEIPDVKPPAPFDTGARTLPEIPFTDITSDAGIDFVHTNGARGQRLLPETMGGGVAFFDVDGDDDQDILFVNGLAWEDDPDRTETTAALYVNDGRGAFTDVTAGSGLDVPLHGMGVAVGDYDADGRVDVFITTLHENRLFRNVDGRRFEDVTAAAGVGGDADHWSSSAGFCDLDGDGALDLFVCNYVQWTREYDERFPFSLNGRDRAYGPPTQFEGQYGYLYRNNGDGTFADISASSGIQRDNAATGAPIGKSLAVTFCDLDDDGRMDLLVANDTVQNFVFRNLGDGRFEEIGVDTALAYDTNGKSTGAMGIDAAAFGEDGAFGVAIGNFAGENTTFYVRQSSLVFAEMSNLHGIGSPSRQKLTFGLFFFDADLDGRLDLLQTNGHLEEEINAYSPSQHYRQPAQLFWNCGAGGACYAVLPETAVGDLATPIVGRGAAYADIDGDGDLDVLLTQTGGRPMLLRNDAPGGHHWLRVHLRARGANRDAIGATVTLVAGGHTQTRTVMPTRSYLSQVELPLTFGLGSAGVVDALTIRWPDGRMQDVAVTGVDTTIIVSEDAAP
ncbi:MAG: CRTAC1 family protein [Phycisphaerales bacterium]|nr:CRTAC1 family protein [Phycisphaerales bacterium]